MTRLVGEMIRLVSLCLVVIVLSQGLTFGQKLQLEHVRTFNGHEHGVKRVAFSPDGSFFASGGTRGEVFLWSVDGESQLRKLEGHYGSINDLRYSKDGKYLVTAGEDGQVKVWDSSTGLCLQSVLAPSIPESPVNKVNFAVLSVPTQTLYFGGTNRSLCKVPFGSKSDPEVIYTDSKESIRCAAICSKSNELVFAAGSYLMAMDLTTGEVVREYNTGSCIINAIRFSEDGKKLLTWCDNSRVDMRDPSNFYLMTSFRSGTGGRKFSNLAFTEDGKYVVTGDYASRFNVWDLNKQQIVLDQGAEQGTILTFDLESGPNYLLSGSLDKSIKLWHITEVVEEETTKKKPKKEETVEAVVEPEVEIVQYAEPIQDVPQEKAHTPANTNVVLKEPEPKPEPVPVYESVKAVDRVDTELEATLNNRRVKPIRKEHRLVLNSHLLTFEIWDAQVVDGDIVSIYVGDECIVKEYSITADKKVVNYDASKYNKVYIYLHAHNLGTQPPNTVTMTISDGVNKHSVELRSDLSGSSAMELLFLEPEAAE